MREKIGMSTIAAVSATLVMTMVTPAFAYIGPGAGISAIGTFFAVIGAVVLLIVGFLWYPVKRMLRKKKAPAQAKPVQANTVDGTDTTPHKQ